MAFFRYTTVKGNKYYRYVRNYRENGKHKQEVLYYCNGFDQKVLDELGLERPSLEAFIKYHQEKVAHYEERAATSQQKAQLLRKAVLDEIALFYPSYDSPHREDFLERFDAQEARSSIWALEAYMLFFSTHKDDYETYRDRDYARSDYEKWAEKEAKYYYTSLPPEHDHYREGNYNLWEEDCLMRLDLYKMIADYRRAELQPSYAESNANMHRSRLEKFKDLQEKHSKKT